MQSGLNGLKKELMKRGRKNVLSFFEKLKSKRFKIMQFLGMVGIFFLTTESMHENTLVPLIAPLVGTAFMVVWVVLVEMIKIEGERKNGQ